MSNLDDLALLIPCPACGAGPTYWCVTYRPTRRPAGELTTWLHGPRTEPVRLAWVEGFDEGRADEREMVRRQITRCLAVLRQHPRSSTTFELFAEWLERRRIVPTP